MRVRILENELLDIKEEEMVAADAFESASQVYDHLQSEERKLIEEEELLKRTKHVLQNQLAEQRDKLKGINEKKEATAARSTLVVK